MASLWGAGVVGGASERDMGAAGGGQPGWPTTKGETMRKLFKHAPSPAMIVAVVAVILALGGTAVAALSKKEKKQTTNIANNEITKRASSLSVASAGSAGDAAKLG